MLNWMFMFEWKMRNGYVQNGEGCIGDNKLGNIMSVCHESKKLPRKNNAEWPISTEAYVKSVSK